MRKTFTILLTLAFILSACIPGQNPQEVESAVNTAVAQTMQANAQIEQAVNQTLTAQAPLATPTLAFTSTPEPTFEPLIIITDTPLPTSTNTPVRSGGGSGSSGGSGNSSGSSGSAYSCAIVAEKPYDGATFKPGDSFDKSWTIKNTGTVTWEANWEFEYKSGDDISPTGDFLIGKQVRPGDTITLVIDVDVPAVAYKDSGKIFVMTWSLNNGSHFCTPYVAITVVP